MSAYGVIALYRTVELPLSANAFKVWIDGVPAGRIRCGRTAEFPVAPGTHQLRVTAALFYASRPLLLEVSADRRHQVAAYISPTFWDSFRPRRYLVVRELASPTGQ